MQRRIYLAALIAVLAMTSLLFTQSNAAIVDLTGTLRGNQTCSLSFKYHGTPYGWALYDEPLECELAADNKDLRGTGHVDMTLSADLDVNFKGPIWGRYTLTNSRGAWTGSFQGFNSGENSLTDPIPVTAVIGQTVGSGAFKGYQMTQAFSFLPVDPSGSPIKGAYVMTISKVGTVPSTTLTDPYNQAFMCKSGYNVLARANGDGFKSPKECEDYAIGGGRLFYLPDKQMPDYMKAMPFIIGCPECIGITWPDDDPAPDPPTPTPEPIDNTCCLTNDFYDCNLSCIFGGGAAFPPFE